MVIVVVVETIIFLILIVLVVLFLRPPDQHGFHKFVSSCSSWGQLSNLVCVFELWADRDDAQHVKAPAMLWQEEPAMPPIRLFPQVLGWMYGRRLSDSFHTVSWARLPSKQRSGMIQKDWKHWKYHEIMQSLFRGLLYAPFERGVLNLTHRLQRIVLEIFQWCLRGQIAKPVVRSFFFGWMEDNGSTEKDWWWLPVQISSGRIQMLA